MKSMQHSKHFISILFFIILATFSYAQPGGWTQKTDFGGTARNYSVGFSIGNKGYFGTGNDGSYKRDFWEYNPITNSWTQELDFYGIARDGAVGFSIGAKGYIGTGGNSTINKKDFWEYDPSTGYWTQKADFGGVARKHACGFSIGNKGYIGTGTDGSYKKDFWEYDTTTNVWTQKSDFGGAARDGATGFSIGNKGYMGTGFNSSYKKDFWEYDPITNVWTQKTDFGGAVRDVPVGFSIGNKGYIGTGGGGYYQKDFWEYDPISNIWNQKMDFGGSGRSYAAGFSIGGKGYIGIGKNFSSNLKDFWEFDPCPPPLITQQPQSLNRCAGSPATFIVSATGYGALFYQWKHNGTDIPGGTNDTLLLNNITFADIGNYACQIFYICDSILSNTAILTENPTSNGPFNLTTPANGSNVPSTPTFTWTSSSGATFYQLYIDGIFKKDNIIGTSYTLQSNEALSQGMHTWNIRANSCTQSSETWSFIVDATQPNAFNLTAPTNNSWTTFTQPTFQWSASGDGGSGLAKYQLWIDGALNKDNISTSATTTTPNGPLNNGTHSWFIKAIDNVGNFRNSNQTWTIKIDNTPPGFYNHSSLSFDGTNDYVSIGSNSLLNMTYNYTIEAWVCFYSGGNNNPRIISKQIDDWGNPGDYAIYTNGTGSSRTVTFWIQNIGSITTGISLNAGTYYHIAATISGNASSSQMRIYINGIQQALGNTSGTHTPTSTPLVFGRKGIGTNNLDLYCGLLDEVRFWNYCRSQSQIIQYKDIPLTGSESGLIGYWRFDEETGTTAYDQTNNNNGTIYSATYNTSNLPPLLLVCSLYTPINTYLPAGPVLFKWGATPDQGIGFKKFQLFIDNSLKVDNLSDTAISYTLPLNYGLHNWYIKTFDSLDNNQSSPSKAFNIDNARPNPFKLLYPPDSGIVNLPTPNLTWQGTLDSTGGSGLRKYQLWINGVKNRDSIAISQTTTAPSSALNQGAYIWYIKAFDNVGNIRQSSSGSFFPGFYAFSDTVESYTEISGTQLIGGNVNDAVSSLTNIGFNFTYAGTVYTTFSATSNGTVHLGQLGSNSGYTNNLTNGSFRPILAPLWDDLKTGSSGNISYTLSGTVGNRLLTIQFKQMYWFYNSSAPVISFQVKLYESTNNIEFIYKQEGGSPALASASIGISSTDAGPYNFLSLTTTGVSPTVSYLTETTTLSACPATGQVYRFKYIPQTPSNPNSRLFFVDWEPPTAFTLISPIDNDTVRIRRPIFKWHASSDIGSGLLRYELNISGKPIVPVAPSDTSIVLPYNLTNGSYTWFVKAFDRAGSFTSSNVYGFIADIPITISGIFSYNNSQNTPLDSVKVYLKLNNTMKDSIRTDLSGNYLFYLNNNGTYSINSQTTKPWAGVNGTDALKVQRHFAGLEFLTIPIRLSAADVNNSGSINGTDVLKIKRRFASLDTSFIRGNWVFEKDSGGDTIIVNGDDVTQNFYGLCVGDVNGSNNPAPGKSIQPKVILVSNGTMEVTPGQEIEVPIRITSNQQIGGISLVINYQVDLFEVKDVTMNKPGIVFKVIGDNIRIAWSDLDAMDLVAGDPLIYLHLKANENIKVPFRVDLSVTDESELADDLGNLLHDVILNSPILISSIENDDIIRSLTIYPNPANETVKVDFLLNIDANVTLELLSMDGKAIRYLNFGDIPAGNFLKIIDVSAIVNGTYFLKVKISAKDQIHQSNFKLIFQH